jgi:hypothetical protein
MDDGESEDAEIERRSKAIVDGLAHGSFGKRRSRGGREKTTAMARARTGNGTGGPM